MCVGHSEQVKERLRPRMCDSTVQDILKFEVCLVSPKSIHHHYRFHNFNESQSFFPDLACKLQQQILQLLRFTSCSALGALGEPVEHSRFGLVATSLNDHNCEKETSKKDLKNTFKHSNT